MSHADLTWCGDNFQDTRLISSCTLYTCILWVPSTVFCALFFGRYRVTSAYLHFGSLDNKTGVLLFLVQLLCVLQAMLSLLLFLSSDETAVVLLICCSVQALGWALCAVITTRECWRLTTWPGKPTLWFLWGTVCTGLLQVVTANNDVIVYSTNLVRCSIGLTAISILLLAVMHSKDRFYSSREKDRMELDRVSVEINEGNYSRTNTSFSSQQHGSTASSGFFSLSNPILNSSIFRHLLGRSEDSRRHGSASSGGGLSMKGWNADSEDGYAIVDTDEEWNHTYLSDQAGRASGGQSVVLSAMDRHTSLSEYSPPRASGSFPDPKTPGNDDGDEWVTLSGSIGSDFLHDRAGAAGSPSRGVESAPPSSGQGQSQAVKRAMQSQNARIAAAGAASQSFSTTARAAPSRNKSRNLAISNPTAAPASSVWMLKGDRSGLGLGGGRDGKHGELNTDYFSITAAKWGLRRHRLGEGERDSETYGEEDDEVDEIEFEIVVHVSFAKSNSSSSQSAAGDWTARANNTDSGPGGGTAKPGPPDEKWCVWRTGAEVMSLHSQLVIAHGDSAAPRRPKLKSLQPPRVNPAVTASNLKQSSRSISTDRISDRNSPTNFLQSLREEAAASTLSSAAEGGRGGAGGLQGQVVNQSDVAADMRSITLYLTAVLAISNKSANGPSASGGAGGSVGISVGGLGAIYPALLLFLEIYVGGGSLHRSAQDDFEATSSANTVDGSPRGETHTGRSSTRSSFGALSAEDAAALRHIAEEDINHEDWRKVFNKLKSKVVLQDQCVRCRLFRRVVRASDVFNYLQVSNNGYLNEEETLSMGRKLIQCGLLTAVTVGFHGPSEIQFAAKSKAIRSKEGSDQYYNLSITNVWVDAPHKEEEESKESLHPSGAVNADAALLFANSPDYLYFFPDHPALTENPQDRFELIGGEGIEATITNIDTTTDGSVRYCISLKHLAPTPLEPVDRKYNSSGSDRWNVWKRYSDFDKLHSQLQALSLTPPASLPPKTLSMSIMTSGIASVGTSAATAVGILPKPATGDGEASPSPTPANARRDGLQNYIREVIQYILHGGGEDCMRTSETTSSMDGILSLGGFLDHSNATHKMNALIEARLLLSRFLDTQHNQLTIR